MQNIKAHIIIAICLIAIFNSCMTTKPYSVNQEKYLGLQTNSSDIYINKQSLSFYSPFNININPMDRLMLIDFEGDSLYETIELQVYNDFRGKGATVILYGKNGENDVYYTDSVFVNSRLFKGHIYENKEIKYFLNVSNNCLEANVELKDKFGRNISAIIKEGQNTNNPSSFLAPIGGIIKTFSFFPLFYMEKFNFVIHAGTIITIKIDNNILKPKKIPILLNGSFVYLSRYSNEPVISSINDKYDGDLKPMVPTQKDRFIDGNMTYEITLNNSHYEIKRAVCSNSRNKVAISFSPAIPDLINLKQNITLNGKFSMETDSVTGIVAGVYQISRTTDKIEITMNPTKAYSPMTGALWVLSYKWNANITISSSGSVNMNSKWDYIGNKYR